MTESKTERWNPFYLLLIITSFAFVLTALAYAFVPILEQKAREAGQAPPPSPIRDSLRHDGWLWLICEGGVIVLLSVLSMVLDRLRRWKKPPAEG